MKKINNLPISLSHILFNVINRDEAPAREALSEMGVDPRHDFMIPESDQLVVARICFVNERALAGDCHKGIRRKVNVALIDSQTRKLHATTTATVAIKAGIFSREVDVMLPMRYDEINFDHSYSVVVNDLQTGRELGREQLWFFPRYVSGVYATDIFKPDCAGFKLNNDWMLYKSIDAEADEFHYVRFFLRPGDGVKVADVVPEMEVRVCFPDGSLERRFVAPEEYLLSSEEMYLVEVPFYLTASRKGLTYAELICFDEALAGFVFNTSGERRPGRWHKDELEPIGHYTFDNFSRRGKALLS